MTLLEFLSSKLSTALIVLLLLASTTTFFLNKREGHREQELRTVARRVAEFIGTVVSMPVTATFTVSSEVASNLVIPEKVGDGTYLITLWRDSVLIEQGDVACTGHWVGHVHFWEWEGPSISQETVLDLDQEFSSIAFNPHRGIALSNEKVSIDDIESLMTFARFV